ncbi:MAG: HAD family phosphatase [Lachnospiraceae bacterium]|nr:HAD family phosphatase [Lachnospiraceae bacterium]
MKEIKLLALDLDGTLTNHEKKVSEKNKQYIRKAQEKGVEIVLASGRPVIGIRPIADVLELWNTGGYILAYNGGQVIECATGRNLIKKTIPMEYCHEICEVAKRFHAFPLSYNTKGVICENNTNEYVLKEAFNNSIPVIKVGNLEKEVRESKVKFMVVGEPEELKGVSAYLTSIFKGKLNIFFSEPYFLEITPMGIEKASALAKLADNLGIRQDQVMACGDGLNDITMLDYAGLAVAMDNAYIETKKHADYISCSNEDNGVAQAIDQFILKGEGLC